MERIIEKRLEEQRRVIEEVRKFASCVKKVFGEVTVILFGSYARGDFNEWSDVDVLVVTRERTVPKNPLERLNAIEKCLLEYALIEPVILTGEEFATLMRKRNPVAEDVARHGIVLVDDLNIKKLLEKCV